MEVLGAGIVPHCQGFQQLELCEREGKSYWMASPAGAWPHRLSAARRAPGSMEPWVWDAAHTRRLSPWVHSKCLTDVGSLALSTPAERCEGGLGLPLRVWAPAHSPSSGEAAPEPRPPGGAWRPRLETECTACGEASLLGGRPGSPATCVCNPYLGRPECTTRTVELLLSSEARSGRVPRRRLLCPGRALPRLA